MHRSFAFLQHQVNFKIALKNILMIVNSTVSSIMYMWCGMFLGLIVTIDLETKIINNAK